MKTTLMFNIAGIKMALASALFSQTDWWNSHHQISYQIYFSLVFNKHNDHEKKNGIPEWTIQQDVHLLQNIQV